MSARETGARMPSRRSPSARSTRLARRGEVGPHPSVEADLVEQPRRRVESDALAFGMLGRRQRMRPQAVVESRLTRPSENMIATRCPVALRAHSDRRPACLKRGPDGRRTPGSAPGSA